MNEWIRARYGDVNSGHALVSADGISTHELPAELLSLTDRPPGALSRGEQWWPSVGCGPVGHWWACWWCLPDDGAPRGGMVKADVALYPLARVAELDDLRPILCILGDVSSITPPPEDLMAAVWEGLLEADGAPIVLPGLDLLPSLISAIWPRLWPAARRSFAARSALSPPQGDSGAAPWLYAVPLARRFEWLGARVVERRTPSAALSRGARWLLHSEDDRLERVLNVCFCEAPRLREVRRAARIADQVDKLRDSGAPSEGLALAKALEAAAPNPEELADFKEEALEAMLRGLQLGAFDLPRGLRNLSPAPFQAEKPLREALGHWVTQHAPKLGVDDVKLLLEGPTQPATLPWWCEATQTALKEGLACGSVVWAIAALRWLSLEGEACDLVGLLPTNEQTELRLMAQVEGLALDKVSRALLLGRVKRRSWSRLHAAVLRAFVSPGEAIDKQRDFPGDALPGLRWLVSKLPALDSVRAYVRAPDATLLALVVERTRADPSALAGLDPGSAPWRSLWSAHVIAGGEPWPIGVDRAALSLSLLEVLFADLEPPGVVPRIVDDLAGPIFHHPRRAELWTRLSFESVRAVKPKVVTMLHQALEQGQVSLSPEPELLTELLLQWGSRGPVPEVLMRLLMWGLLTDEVQVCQWVGSWRDTEVAGHALTFGDYAKIHQWAKFAKLLYSRSRYGNNIGQGAWLCSDLLSTIDRVLLRWKSDGEPTTRRDVDLLCGRVAELGADLAPDRLDSIWESAGGTAKQLGNHVDRQAAWREAARFAHYGKLKGGLFALTNVLGREFPENRDVSELLEVLVRDPKHSS